MTPRRRRTTAPRSEARLFEAGHSMNLTVIVMMVVIAIGGGHGGSANAFRNDHGFALPRTETVPSGGTIMRPGHVGNSLEFRQVLS